MRVFDRRAAGFWPGEGCGVAVLATAEAAEDAGRVRDDPEDRHADRIDRGLLDMSLTDAVKMYREAIEQGTDSRPQARRSRVPSSMPIDRGARPPVRRVPCREPISGGAARDPRAPCRLAEPAR